MNRLRAWCGLLVFVAWTARAEPAAAVTYSGTGRVLAAHRIADGDAGFSGSVANQRFGRAVTALGDVDGDGVVDLAVGAPDPNDVALGFGSVWILFLNADGSVKASQRIGWAFGGLGGEIAARDWFGFGVAGLGDVDLDGVPDLAVGAPGADGVGDDEEAMGRVWVLFLNANGTVPMPRCSRGWSCSS